MKVLFCGLGSIGQRHLRNLRQLLGDELQVHAYRVRGQRIKLKEGGVEEGADLERDYGVVVHESLAQALASNPDAAFICNPNSLHIPVALACAHAGVAIFMEKPLASELEGIAELDALVREKNLLFHVGYNYRFHPGLQRIKTLVDEGFFGRLLTARGEIGEHLPDWHRYEDYRQMYASRAVQGGGVIRSQIHEMDLICWLFGLPATTCPSATGSFCFTRISCNVQQSVPSKLLAIVALPRSIYWPIVCGFSMLKARCASRTISLVSYVMTCTLLRPGISLIAWAVVLRRW